MNACKIQHIKIEDNEEAVKLAKEARDWNNNTTSLVTLDDGNDIARYRLKEKTSEVIIKFAKLMPTKNFQR